MMSDEEEIDVMGDIYETPILNFDNAEAEWSDIGVEKITGSDLLDEYAYSPIVTHCDSTSELNDLTSLPPAINVNSSDAQSVTNPIEEDLWTEDEKKQLEKGLSLYGTSWAHLQLWMKTKTEHQIKKFVSSQNYQRNTSGQNFLNNSMSDDFCIDQSEIILDREIPTSMEVVVEAASPVSPNKSFASPKSFKKCSKSGRKKKKKRCCRKKSKISKPKNLATPKKKKKKSKKQNATAHHSSHVLSKGEEVIVMQKETEDLDDVEISVDDKGSDNTLPKTKTKERGNKNFSPVNVVKDVNTSPSSYNNKNGSTVLTSTNNEERPASHCKSSKKFSKTNLKNTSLKVPLAIIKDGGYTISHNADGTPSQTTFIENPQKRLRSKQDIALLQCGTFKGKNPAPFDVVLSVEAVVIMDIHAHSSIFEAGGLLGGRYDASSKTLFIKLASPCQSESTKVQCDLCPVAMMEAMEEFQKYELNVVGWYHSHPTFLPNPSLQDVATQKNIQNWFADTAGCPVISFIISPFCSLNKSIQSRYRCLILSENTNDPIPFEIKPKISPEYLKRGFVLKVLDKLLGTASKKKELITDFDEVYKQQGISKLNKCVESCRMHLISCNPPVPENLTKHILQEVVKVCKAYKDMKNSVIQS